MIERYMPTRYIHIPTRKVYRTNGASGLINDNSNTAIPLWLTENSQDWFKVDNGDYNIDDDLINTLIELHKARQENRKLLIERGWGSLTDDEFTFYFNHLKDTDYFKSYSAKKIKILYAEFQKTGNINNILE